MRYDPRVVLGRGPLSTEAGPFVMVTARGTRNVVDSSGWCQESAPTGGPMRPRMQFAVAIVAVLCAACTSTPQRVQALASDDLRCEASEVVVNRMQKGGYWGDDVYEAKGCGQRATYSCERIQVLMIPAGTMGCGKTG